MIIHSFVNFFSKIKCETKHANYYKFLHNKKALLIFFAFHVGGLPKRFRFIFRLSRPFMSFSGEVPINYQFFFFNNDEKFNCD